MTELRTSKAPALKVKASREKSSTVSPSATSTAPVEPLSMRTTESTLAALKSVRVMFFRVTAPSFTWMPASLPAGRPVP